MNFGHHIRFSGQYLKYCEDVEDHCKESGDGKRMMHTVDKEESLSWGKEGEIGEDR